MVITNMDNFFIKIVISINNELSKAESIQFLLQIKKYK